MNLTKNFEYNIFPSVIDYVDNHKILDAKTALLIFITDTVRNAVNYDAISNNVKREKEVEQLYPRFTEQILDLGSQYRSYLDEYKQLEEALCRLPDLSNDYIRGNYSRENVSRVLEMLNICESDIFPAFNALNKFSVPEVQEINDTIAQLLQYRKNLQAQDIANVDDLLDKLYTTTHECFKSVLNSIGFGEIPILYREVLENTGKEKTFYFAESPIIKVESGVKNILTNLTDPDKDRVDAIKKIFYGWFTGNVNRELMADTRDSILNRPTLASLFAYMALIEPLSNITHINDINNDRLNHVVQALRHLASIVDNVNKDNIKNRLEDAMQKKTQEERVMEILKVFDDVSGKLHPYNIIPMITLIINFYTNMLSNSRYIPITHKVTEPDDMRRAAVIDKRRVLKAVSAYDLTGIQIAPFIPKSDSENDTIHNRVQRYLAGFLGNDSKKSDSRLDAYKTAVSNSLWLKYQDNWESKFGSIRDKILANIPDDTTNAEIAFLRAVSRVWENPKTTDEEREILERLIPPTSYIDFVYSAAQSNRDDIVRASLKPLNGRELCIIAPDKWQTPDQVTDQDIEEYMTDLVMSLKKNTVNMNFTNFISTAGFEDQDREAAVALFFVQSFNKLFEGKGKMSMYVDPSANNNNGGVDIIMPLVIRLGGGYIAMGTCCFDCKSISNADIKSGSALGNIEQSIQGLFVFDESKKDEIYDQLSYMYRHLDEVLPQLIDKEHTYLFSKMDYNDVKIIIGSFIKYFMFLPDEELEYLHLDTLAPDKPRNTKSAGKFKDFDFLHNIAAEMEISKIQEKYVFGETLSESNYILQALFQRIPGIKYVFVNAPGYISAAGTRDSLTPSTARQENNLRQSTILKDRDDITR